MDVCYVFIFYIHYFSLNRTDVAAKQRCVTQNQRQDGVKKCQCCLKETCPGVTTIFQTVQRYALFLVRNVNSIVDVEVWIMGGVILQGMVMPMLSKAKKQYLCASNVYYDRVRKNCSSGHNPPFLSFFDFFFVTFPLKTPSGMTGKPLWWQQLIAESQLHTEPGMPYLVWCGDRSMGIIVPSVTFIIVNNELH